MINISVELVSNNGCIEFSQHFLDLEPVLNHVMQVGFKLRLCAVHLILPDFKYIDEITDPDSFSYILINEKNG